MLLTNQQLLKEVTALITPLKERIDVLENQQVTIPPAAKNDFVFTPVIVHFGLTKEKQQEFFNKLQAMMREYQITAIVANLNKKF